MSTEIRPITEVLEDLRSGAAHELTAGLAELVQAVQATNKKGTLTLKLTVAPSKTDDCAVTVTDDLAVKSPQPDRPPTLMYANPSGSLTKTDPRQRTLPGVEEETDR